MGLEKVKITADKKEVFLWPNSDQVIEETQIPRLKVSLVIESGFKLQSEVYASICSQCH